MRGLAVFYCMLGVLAVSSTSIWADESALPGAGWTAERYENLWIKSPFSVATPAAAAASTDYSLWGVARIGGISYASVTNKQNNEHFLLSTEKPARGLTLVSIKRGDDSKETFAVVQKEDGESISLKLEEAPAVSGVPMANASPNPNGVPMPGNPNQQSPANNMGMPSNRGGIPGQQQIPPIVMRRPPIIHVPPNPQVQQVPTPQPINR